MDTREKHHAFENIYYAIFNAIKALSVKVNTGSYPQTTENHSIPKHVKLPLLSHFVAVDISVL